MAQVGHGSEGALKAGYVTGWQTYAQMDDVKNSIPTPNKCSLWVGGLRGCVFWEGGGSCITNKY